MAFASSSLMMASRRCFLRYSGVPDTAALLLAAATPRLQRTQAHTDAKQSWGVTLFGQCKGTHMRQCKGTHMRAPDPPDLHVLLPLLVTILLQLEQQGVVWVSIPQLGDSSLVNFSQEFAHEIGLSGRKPGVFVCVCLVAHGQG